MPNLLRLSIHPRNAATPLAAPGLLRAVVFALAMVVAGGLSAAGRVGAAAGQPAHEAAPSGQADHAAASGSAEEHGETAEHGESLVSFLSRIANFLILAGGLYYLLRSPIRNYLDARGEQIRGDLQQAAATRAQATRSLADIEAQVQKLPAELEALKDRGKAEIAAEQVRMAKAADAERARLMEQTRREIDRQLQIARRELTEHAADLAVGVARTRLSHELTPEEQMRLVDRYAEEIGGRRG